MHSFIFLSCIVIMSLDIIRHVECLAKPEVCSVNLHEMLKCYTYPTQEIVVKCPSGLFGPKVNTLEASVYDEDAGGETGSENLDDLMGAMTVRTVRTDSRPTHAPSRKYTITRETAWDHADAGRIHRDKPEFYVYINTVCYKKDNSDYGKNYDCQASICLKVFGDDGDGSESKPFKLKIEDPNNIELECYNRTTPVDPNMRFGTHISGLD